MTCKPKVVTKIVVVPRNQPPFGPIECSNCGCTIPPGTCHCGAEMRWEFDRFDGWRRRGSIALEVALVKAEE